MASRRPAHTILNAKNKSKTMCTMSIDLHRIVSQVALHQSCFFDAMAVAAANTTGHGRSLDPERPDAEPPSIPLCQGEYA